MQTLTQTDKPPIVRGIKAVGIGKKGSKPLDPELIREIIADLKAKKVTPAAQGAFFAALTIKGITSQETALDEAFSPGTLSHPERLV